MKIKLSLIALPLFAAVLSSSAVTISSFGTDISGDLTGAWAAGYTSGTSTLDSSVGPGNSISDFTGPAIADITGLTFLTLVANTIVDPGTSFVVSIYDGEGDAVSASFSWSEFVGGSQSVSKALGTNVDFDGSAVIGWDLLPGGISGALNVQFSSLSAVSAVPEPSTYAALAGLFALSAVALRRRRA